MAAKTTKKRAKTVEKRPKKPTKVVKKTPKAVNLLEKALTQEKVEQTFEHIPSVPAVLSKADLELLDSDRAFAIKLPYVQELADEIIEKVFEGESLSKIAKLPGMPQLSDIYKWFRRNAEFRDMYDLAKSTEGLRAYEEILAISKESRKAEAKDVPGLKLSADLYKWIAERTDRKAFAASEPKTENSGVIINISTGIQREVDTRTQQDVIDEIRNVGQNE